MKSYLLYQLQPHSSSTIYQFNNAFKSALGKLYDKVDKNNKHEISSAIRKNLAKYRSSK